MTINDINTLDKLKEYGSFKEVTTILETHCGFNIQTKDWKHLFETLQSIEKILSRYDKDLFITNNFGESKKIISEKLGLYSCADGFEQLNNDFDKLISFFIIKNFDPYEEFEKSKSVNFKYSSKLEGINIEDTNQSLNEIIKKYKVATDG